MMLLLLLGLMPDGSMGGSSGVLMHVVLAGQHIAGIAGGGNGSSRLQLQHIVGLHVGNQRHYAVRLRFHYIALLRRRDWSVCIDVVRHVLLLRFRVLLMGDNKLRMNWHVAAVGHGIVIILLVCLLWCLAGPSRAALTWLGRRGLLTRLGDRLWRFDVLLVDAGVDENGNLAENWRNRYWHKAKEYVCLRYGRGAPSSCMGTPNQIPVIASIYEIAAAVRVGKVAHSC
uniref:Secreted protein n=1 Tax=Glossina austeni TaxID=7395 RepID=A0A1A9ULG5_GLOAU